MFGEVVEKFKYIELFKTKIVNLQNTILEQFKATIQCADQII